MSDETTLRNTLDQLMHAAGDAPDTRWTTTVLAAAVVDLEHAAGACLGPAEHDPLVVLHRRLGRAHRLLLAAPRSVSLELVREHLQALRHPAPTPEPATANDPHAPALSHAC